MLYAIGEIALVVIGILIALQINNWNEAQKMLKKEIKIYKEIHSELTETLDDVEDDISDLQRNFQASIDVSHMIIKNEINQDSLLKKSHYVFDLEKSTPKTSAFESLKSIGLDILSNDSLRQEITTLYQLTIPSLSNSENVERFEKYYKRTTNSFEPYLQIDRNWVRSRIDQNEISYGRPQIRLKPGSKTTLLKDEELIYNLQIFILNQRNGLRRHRGVKEVISKILSDIEVEIVRLE
jgi:hypothetical protein